MRQLHLKVNQFRGLFKAPSPSYVCMSPELFRVGNAPWNYGDMRINGIPRGARELERKWKRDRESGRIKKRAGVEIKKKL